MYELGMMAELLTVTVSILYAIDSSFPVLSAWPNSKSMHNPHFQFQSVIPGSNTLGDIKPIQRPLGATATVHCNKQDIQQGSLIQMLTVVALLCSGVSAFNVGKFEIRQDECSNDSPKVDCSEL